MPFLLSFPPTPLPCHPSGASQSTRWGSLGYTAASHWFSVLLRGSVYMSVLLSQFIPPSPSPAGSTSPLSMSASLFLPCKQDHQYHFSKFHQSVSQTVQSLSRVWLFATPWIAARQASLSTTNSRSLLKLMPIELVMPSSHLILCRPLLLLPPIPPSIRVFSNESVLRIRWPKYQNFSFSISPFNKHPGLISFRMDWLDLLAVQGTLKSLLQHHSSKASKFHIYALIYYICFLFLTYSTLCNRLHVHTPQFTDSHSSLCIAK